MDVDKEKELIKDEAKDLIDEMLRHARTRDLDEVWVLEQFRIALNAELREWIG